VRKQREEAVEERFSKLDSLISRSQNDMSHLHESLRGLQEERRRDVEETAEFVKQVIGAGKAEWQKEVGRLTVEMDRVRRETSEKANANEVAEMLAKITTTLEGKVDLREVQQALNECQTDIKDQLVDFRQQLQGDHRQTELDLRKIVERKAGVQEMQEALSLKANARDLPSRDEVQECLFKVDRMQGEVAGKVDTRCKSIGCV
jgi:hypothetical protein